MSQLAKACPQLEAIQVQQTHILEIVRDGEEDPRLQPGDITRLDRMEFDEWPLEVDWVHRVVSKQREREEYKEQVESLESLEEICKLLCTP